MCRRYCDAHESWLMMTFGSTKKHQNNLFLVPVMNGNKICKCVEIVHQHFNIELMETNKRNGVLSWKYMKYRQLLGNIEQRLNWMLLRWSKINMEITIWNCKTFFLGALFLSKTLSYRAFICHKRLHRCLFVQPTVSTFSFARCMHIYWSIHLLFHGIHEGFCSAISSLHKKYKYGSFCKSKRNRFDSGFMQSVYAAMLGDSFARRSVYILDCST